MSSELPVPPPLLAHQEEKPPVEIWVDQRLQGQPPPVLTPEQTRALDALYADQQEGHSAMACVFALWAGTALLTDLAEEHFHLPQQKPTPRKPEPDRRED